MQYPAIVMPEGVERTQVTIWSTGVALDGDLYRPRSPGAGLAPAVNALAEVPKLEVPTLLLDAGDEDLFDIRANSGRAYEILKAKEAAPVRYEVIPGIEHYGVYFAGFERSSEAALAWFRSTS